MAAQIAANVADVVKSGYKTNAFAPIVWFNAVADPLLITASIISNDEVLRWILISILCLIIISSLFVYFYLLFKNPELLQSEKYRIQNKTLDLIASKGSGITIEPVNLTTPILRLGDDD